MKRALLLVVVAMALVGTFGGGVVSAQDAVRVNVPFQFTVNHKVMAPGTYEITMADPTVVSVMPQKGSAVIAPVITRLAQRGTPVSAAEVVFDKVGDQYTLSEVWVPSDDGFLLNDLKQAHQHHVIKGTKASS